MKLLDIDGLEAELFLTRIIVCSRQETVLKILDQAEVAQVPGIEVSPSYDARNDSAQPDKVGIARPFLALSHSTMAVAQATTTSNDLTTITSSLNHMSMGEETVTKGDAYTMLLDDLINAAPQTSFPRKDQYSYCEIQARHTTPFLLNDEDRKFKIGAAGELLVCPAPYHHDAQRPQLDHDFSNYVEADV